MGLASIFEFVLAIFENADVLEIVNMLMGVVGPHIGDLLK